MGARFGRYETLHPIASGGMATVHLARAVGAGGFERLVAVKVMHPGLGDDPDFAAMFLDEARVAARIRHPNVVGTVDVQDGPDGLFLVMEYVEGPSLSAIVRALARRQARLPIGVALRIMVDALVGLHAAHEQTGPGGEPLHIIHRDVSPQNILVGLDGLTKITDFGVARAESRISSTRRGEVKGKLAYISPQQVRTEPIDRRADVYSAGVVLWELLVGERLFKSDNEAALILAVMKGVGRSPRQVDPRVPEPIDRACMRALSLDVEARYPTALAFADALEAAAEEAGVALASTRALSTFVKELRAHKPIDVPPMAEEAAPSARTPRSAPGTPAPALVPLATLGDTPGLATAASGGGSPAERSSGGTVAGSVQADPSTHVASVVSSPAAGPPPTASRKRAGIALVALALVVGGLAAGWIFGRGATAPPAPAAIPAAVAPPPQAQSPSATASASADPASQQAPALPSTGERPAVTVDPPATPVMTGRPVATSGHPATKGPRANGATEWRAQGL